MVSYTKDKVKRIQLFNYVVVGTEPIENLEKYKDHRRLGVYYHKGTKCCRCERKGTILTHGLDKDGNLHIDLCTEDYHPITIDHIIPKSKGGSNHLSNLRPMCYECNRRRGNKDDDHEFQSKQS
jgi:5-methylcytosine-specific restriction endonuclease McrA